MSLLPPSERLPAPAGSRLDRRRPRTLRFEGRSYPCFEGDTIASALAANGVRMLSRSFKYHRPRGVLTLRGYDANTMVQLAHEPNVRADVAPVPQDEDVLAQNYVGSLERDWQSLVGVVGRFLPVGFYYKAFYRPRWAWRWWERLIRHMAGLGRVNPATRHGYVDKMHLFPDVAVIGGGIAGMESALAAAAEGAEVLLVEQEPALGGALAWARIAADAGAGRARVAALVARVDAEPRIRVLTRADCTGWFADRWLSVVQPGRLWKVRARSIVLATGAIEQPVVFRNNDLPGVMLGSAAQRLIALYGVRPGRRAVVLTGDGSGYGVALDLDDAGVEVEAVVDMREGSPAEPLAQVAAERGLRIFTGHTVHAAGADRRGGLAHVVVDRIVAPGRVADRPQRVECDLLCMGSGVVPLAQLACHSGGELRWDEARGCLLLTRLPDDCAFAVGAVTGRMDPESVAREARHVGWRAAAAAGLAVGAEPPVEPPDAGPPLNHPWPIFTHPKGKEFVDFDEDLVVADIRNAVADGYDDMDLVKRYSTVVMGPSQGRHSALSALRLTCEATARPMAGVSVTTQRPPAVPEILETLAGRPYQPLRRTAMHHRHLELGAQMMPAGAWLRPAFYGPASRRGEAIREEVHAVRNAVGLIDVSTLGKLELRGPDVVEFMNRMYTSNYAKLAVGRSRYVVMTDATGAVVDDGVACRFGEQHFYVTATTSGIDAVFRAMTRWNTEWRLDVDIANVTAAWAAVNLAGPRSREVLARLGGDVDLSAAAFPYLGVREGRIAGTRARLARVGFVGELGYEIHVPHTEGEAFWDRLMEAGREDGIRAFGVEAQRVLRLEKGHIIVGQDTDGLTFPHEAGLDWSIGKGKPFFIGQRAIAMQAARPLSRVLVGFELPLGAPLPEECNLTLEGDAISGRVTSAAESQACGRIVGLAYVSPTRAEPGSRFTIKLSSGATTEATVVRTPFYDPDNRRQAE